MVTLYTEKENGDLKFLAEVDDVDDPGTAVEALLEDNPRVRADYFVALVGSTEDGVLTTVRQVEETNVRWAVSANGVVVDEEEDEEEVPVKRGPGRPRKTETAAPKRRGRPPGSGKKKAAATASTGKRGRQATLTTEVLEEAMELANNGMTMKDVAAEVGVSSAGYLARKIREEFGDDALGEVKRGRPPAAGKAAPAAAKRGRGRPKGSTNAPKAGVAKRGPGRPKGSGKVAGKKKVVAKKSPFASRGDDD